MCGQPPFRRDSCSKLSLLALGNCDITGFLRGHGGCVRGKTSRSREVVFNAGSVEKSRLGPNVGVGGYPRSPFVGWPGKVASWSLHIHIGKTWDAPS